MVTERATVLLRVSLGVNVSVLIAVCTVLIAFGDSEPVIFAWGASTPGRGILLSIYFAILVVSILLFWFHVQSGAHRAIVEHMAAALLVIQILYKITTPVTAGATNPVALSNLGVSVLHAITLSLLWRRYRARP